jgi:ubiquitin C-terminal hydrolase
MSGVFGLVNLGNTCFLNSVLVSLSAIRPFLVALSQLCVKMDQIDWKQYDATANNNVQIIRNLNVILQGKVKAPRQFIRHFNDKHPGLAGFQQQDAHEAFNFIVDLVHESIQGINLFFRDNPQLMKDETMQDAWQAAHSFRGLITPRENVYKAVTPKEILPFAGLYSDFLTFPCGHQPEVKLVPYTSISLSLPPNRPSSLAECLKAFTIRETVEGVSCDTCKEKKTIAKQLLFAKPPEVLCFHFIRLLGDYKIDSFVSFPFMFDLAPFMATEQSYAKTFRKDFAVDFLTSNMFQRQAPVHYQLRAVIVHHGSAYGGHYTSLRVSNLDETSNMWYHVSDEDIVETQLGTVMQAQAYMLFYEKISTLRTAL